MITKHDRRGLESFVDKKTCDFNKEYQIVIQNMEDIYVTQER